MAALQIRAIPAGVSLWFGPCHDPKSIAFICSIKHATLHQVIGVRKWKSCVDASVKCGRQVQTQSKKQNTGQLARCKLIVAMVQAGFSKKSVVS